MSYLLFIPEVLPLPGLGDLHLRDDPLVARADRRLRGLVDGRGSLLEVVAGGGRLGDLCDELGLLDLVVLARVDGEVGAAEVVGHVPQVRRAEALPGWQRMEGS